MILPLKYENPRWVSLGVGGIRHLPCLCYCFNALQDGSTWERYLKCLGIVFKHLNQGKVKSHVQCNTNFEEKVLRYLGG